MEQFLQLFILLPLAGFVVSLLLPRKNEKLIARLTLGLIAIHFLGIMIFTAYWLFNSLPALDIRHITLYKTSGFEIFIDLYFDAVTAVFASVGSLLTFLVAVFSRYYLHREEGFKRFFNTILLFFTGYQLIIFSGNFETMFIGWEFLGISSFLLIAFYRDRYLPVKNGLKVISLYRLSDVCLLLAMWLSHHFWHENITFIKMTNAEFVAARIAQDPATAFIIALLILIAAAIKSAQIPFSTWLPRAMEGPTSSSAIFYGSLAVHIGVFVLLRTYPFWHEIDIIRYAIIAVGLITLVIGNQIAMVQSTIKTQIAYASVVQIGIIFIEVALGWHTLALIHFTGNAFLRTYQLLVSPSVLSYRIHDQFYHFKPDSKPVVERAFSKWKNSIYILSVKEWNLDTMHYRFLWQPFKWLGRQFDFLTRKSAPIVLFVLLSAGVLAVFGKSSSMLNLFLSPVFSIAALVLVLISFAIRSDARTSWVMLVFSQAFLFLSVMLNEPFTNKEILIYLSGTAISATAGYLCLQEVKKIDHDIEMNGFHGYVLERPGLAFLFLLSCLGLLGFPVTSTFIGVDILFTHIHQREYLLILFSALSFVFIEIAALRIYGRIFLGQHKKALHPVAFRSS